MANIKSTVEFCVVGFLGQPRWARGCTLGDPGRGAGTCQMPGCQTQKGSAE